MARWAAAALVVVAVACGPSFEAAPAGDLAGAGSGLGAPGNGPGAPADPTTDPNAGQVDPNAAQDAGAPVDPNAPNGPADGGPSLSCPNPADPAVHYLSQDWKKCAAAFFQCNANQTGFSDACGCGCIDQKKCPDPKDPKVRYISQDPKKCMVILFACNAGETGFSDSCGCGCIR